MIRRIISPGSPLIAAAVLAKSSEESADSNKGNSLICKPSALPIYSPHGVSEIKSKREHKPSKVAATIEEGVKAVRQEVSKVTDVYDTQKAHLERYYVNFMKDTQHMRNYLQEEGNTFPRFGAIAVGSFAGVVLGSRGGFFKKFFYASITGSAVASVCYPRDAKKYAQVVYNFAYGIKPGEVERQKDLPKFPTTLGELKDNVVSLSSMAYEAAFGKK